MKGVSDADLLKLQRDGAKIVKRNPVQAPDTPPTDVEIIVSAIRDLGASIAKIPQASVKVDAPHITVKPAAVTVEPRQQFRKFRVTIDERDDTAERRMKSFTIEAIE